VETDREDVLAIDARVDANKRLVKNAEGKVPLKIQLNGFDAVVGTMNSQGKDIAFDLKVEDSKISPNLTSPWEGSCLELFFANPAYPTVNQLFLVPQAKGKKALVLTRDLKELSGAKAEQNIQPTGYTVKFTLPRKALGIPAEGEFLFDIIANLTALGDAHSGGRTALNGEFDSSAHTEHYSVVDLG